MAGRRLDPARVAARDRALDELVNAATEPPEPGDLGGRGRAWRCLMCWRMRAAHGAAPWARTAMHGVIDSHVLWQLVSVITGMLWALP